MSGAFRQLGWQGSGLLPSVTGMSGELNFDESRGELTSVARDRSGQIVEGDPKVTRRQRDIWTFERMIGSADPNWRLVATGE